MVLVPIPAAQPITIAIVVVGQASVSVSSGESTQSGLREKYERD
jgi:hypothetical protein